MILAFTGTREGMTAAQRAALPSLLAVMPTYVLHGGEVDGADCQFHDWLVGMSYDPRRIFIFPGDGRQEAYWLECQRREYKSNRKHETIGTFHICGVMPYLKRNRLIVERSDHLLACPRDYMEQLRSGTWATVRAARKLGRPCTIIAPDGAVKGKEEVTHNGL